MTDKFAMPTRERRIIRATREAARVWRDMAARLPIIALVFTGFFAISWRPLYAAAGAMSFFIIFTGLRAPNTSSSASRWWFSDIAMVADVFKYKSIFYANSLNIVFWLVAFSVFFGVSGSICISSRACCRPCASVSISCWRSCWRTCPGSLFYGPVNRPVAALVQRLVASPTSRSARCASHLLLGHFPLHPLAGTPAREGGGGDFRGLLCRGPDHHRRRGRQGAAHRRLQSESFIDMRHFGVDTIKLPNIDGCQKLSAQWVPALHRVRGRLHAAHRICGAERAGARSSP